MTEWLNDWLNEWLNDWITEWMNKWLTDWLNEWINNWMNEWMNEWMLVLQVLLRHGTRVVIQGSQWLNIYIYASPTDWQNSEGKKQWQNFKAPSWGEKELKVIIPVHMIACCSKTEKLSSHKNLMASYKLE